LFKDFAAVDYIGRADGKGLCDDFEILCWITVKAKSMGSNIQTYKHIKTQSDGVLHFLQRLDIEMIDSVLEPNRTYQDFEKHIFVQKLGYALDEFIQSGDTCLHRYPGQCNSEICNYKCKGFTFIGHNSGNYFDLIIDIKEGIVKDIYECSLFKCFNQIHSKNKCIKIDKSALPF
jgi:hypothetical protein